MHVQQCVRKHLALCHRNYGHPTVWTLKPRQLAYKIWGCMQEYMQEAHDSAEAAAVGGLGWLCTDHCRQVIDQWLKWLWACAKAKTKDSSLTHAVTCDAAHCLNIHTVLTVLLLLFQSRVAVSCCYGNGLSWYPATNTEFVQHFNFIKNWIHMFYIKCTYYYWYESRFDEIMPENHGSGFIETQYNMVVCDMIYD